MYHRAPFLNVREKTLPLPLTCYLLSRSTAFLAVLARYLAEPFDTESLKPHAVALPTKELRGLAPNRLGVPHINILIVSVYEGERSFLYAGAKLLATRQESTNGESASTEMEEIRKASGCDSRCRDEGRSGS